MNKKKEKRKQTNEWTSFSPFYAFPHIGEEKGARGGRWGKGENEKGGAHTEKHKRSSKRISSGTVRKPTKNTSPYFVFLISFSIPIALFPVLLLFV